MHFPSHAVRVLLACCLLNISSATDQVSGQTSDTILGPLAGVKCIVDGARSCDTRYWLAYREGLIFFCSDSNRKQFESSLAQRDQQPWFAEPLLTRANHQLAITGQARQFACPITGKTIDPERKVPVAGVDIFVHDLAAAEKLESARNMLDRAQLVYSPGVFEKTFHHHAPQQQLWIDVQQVRSQVLIAEQQSTRCQR